MKERVHTENNGNGTGFLQKTGIARVWDLLLRRGWDLFLTNLILLAGICPGILLIIWGIWGRSLPLALLGGAVAGLAGGPLLCGLYDTVVWALHGESGFWSLYYKSALKRSWKSALPPGAVTGLILALWLFEAFLLGAQGPVPLFVMFILVEVLFFLLGVANYVFPQLTMTSVSASGIYFRSIRLFLSSLPRSIAAAAVQTAYWVCLLLLLPRSVPMLAVSGFWLPCLLSMMILIEPMEENMDLSEEDS